MSLANKSASYLTRDIFLFITNLFTSIVIARNLGPEIMGIWIALNFIPAYAEMFGRTKIDISAIYFLGKGKYEIGDVRNALNLIASISGILIIILIIIFLENISILLFKEEFSLYRDYIILISTVIPLNLFYLNYLYLHNSREDVVSMNYMILSRVLSLSLIGIPGLIFFNFGVFHLIFCLIGSYIFALTIGVLKFKDFPRKGPFINFKLLRDLFKYASNMYISGLFISLNSYIANTFLLLYGSASQITFYALAQQFSYMLLKIIDSMNVFIFPAVSKKKIEEAGEFISKAFRTATVIMIPVIFLSSLSIYPAIYFLYGEAFLPIVLPFLILLIGILFSSTSSSILMFFVGTGNPQIIAKILTIPVLIQLIISPFVIPSFGIIGAAGVLSLGMILSSIIQVIIFLNLSNQRFKKDLFFRKSDLKRITSFFKESFTNILRKKVF